ncbi:Chaperone of endosialidase [Chitinophaga sp. CF118]|uniref:tail fiber domain-containing protein n=1 Tax=Chitinophaga sp. CF118 TaxID=1884367 RepID=UPI0008EBFAA7|nr:tail fiber domain-containing protein [Chitinophaga sp. CF118]SFF06236.1 Chaperone of endosialidase [Chitinophaga sp. CF118]
MNHSIIVSLHRKPILVILIMLFICSLSNPVFSQDPLFIDPNGNVGVGTNKPLSKFHVIGNAQIDGNLSVKGLLYLNGSATSVPNVQGTYFLWNRTCPTGPCLGATSFINHQGGGSGGFQFENTPNGNDITTLMTLSGSGLLGIGTTTPGYKITLAGSGNVFGVDNSAVFVARNKDGNPEQYLWPRGSDNVTYFNYGAGGFNIRNNASNSTMFMTNSSQVGIGNTSPYGPLDVSGNIYTSIHGNPGNEHDAVNRGSRRIGMSLNSDFTGMELVTEKWGCGNGGMIKFLTWGCDQASTREVMRITEDAMVGINTTNTTAPLTVGNTITRSYAIQDQVSQIGYQWNRDRGNDFIWGLTGRSGDKANFDLSIYAAGGIMGKALYAFSDVRIKKNMVISNSKNDLILLNKLKVTDYQYKDNIAHGTSVSKGFIAQEVEAIFPGAVGKHADFLPDIFTMADKATVKGSELTVSLKAPHNMVSGDVVRLMTDGTNPKDVIVNVVDATSFTVANWSGSTAALFVYGKKVSDFRTVDYQQIFSLGISAMQELSQEITSLKKENAANQKLITDIQARLLALEKK